MGTLSLSLSLSLQVLQCISQLEMAQLIGTGVKTRYITHSNSPQPNKKKQRSNAFTAISTSHIDSVISGGGKHMLY